MAYHRSYKNNIILIFRINSSNFILLFKQNDSLIIYYLNRDCLLIKHKISIQPPPLALLPIYNENEFVQNSSATLTIGQADLRYLKLAGGIENGAVVFSSGLSSTNPINLANGTAALPSLTFSSDPNLGVYRIGADDLGFSTNGVLRLDLSTTALTSTLPYLGQNGAAANPSLSFSADSTMGIYRIGANDLGFAIGGVLKFDISSTALTSVLPLYLPNGTVSAPSLTFTSDTSNNTGFYRIGEDDLGLATGGIINNENIYAQPQSYSGMSLIVYYPFRNSLLTDVVSGFNLTNNNVVTSATVTDSTQGITLYNAANFVRASSQSLSVNISGNALATAINGNQVSFSFWFYTTLAGNTGDLITLSNSTYGTSVGTSGGRVLIFFNGAGNLDVLFDLNAQATYLEFRYPVNQSQWYHVVITCGPSGSQLFIDSILVTPTYITGNSSTAWQAQPSFVGLYLGCRGATQFADGALKHVAIGNTILTAAMVQNLYLTQVAEVLNLTNSMHGYIGDTDTGLLRQKNDTLALCSAGQTKLRSSTTGITLLNKSETNATATVVLNDQNYQVLLSAASAVAVTLPLSTSGLYSGKQYVLVKVSSTASGAVTISTLSGDTINGSLTSISLTNQYDRIELSCDGANNWWIL